MELTDGSDIASGDGKYEMTNLKPGAFWKPVGLLWSPAGRGRSKREDAGFCTRSQRVWVSPRIGKTVKQTRR